MECFETLRYFAICTMGASNKSLKKKNMIYSRLANQSGNDCLIANKVHGIKFTLQSLDSQFEVAGVFSLLIFWPVKLVTLSQIF